MDDAWLCPARQAWTQSQTAAPQKVARWRRRRQRGGVGRRRGKRCRCRRKGQKGFSDYSGGRCHFLLEAGGDRCLRPFVLFSILRLSVLLYTRYSAAIGVYISYLRTYLPPYLPPSLPTHLSNSFENLHLGSKDIGFVNTALFQMRYRSVMVSRVQRC